MASDGSHLATKPMSDVFTTSDLLMLILRPLVDANSLSTLLSLSSVSTQFQQLLASDPVWRELCRQRWKTKWGFCPRWEKALADYAVWNRDVTDEVKGGTDNTQHNTYTGGNFWRLRYISEEQDSTRQNILIEELNKLVFDFRFWIGHPTVVDERIVVKSGLLNSASTDVRFAPSSSNIANDWWSARGVLTGHPCNESGVEWFLDEASGIIQWGFPPDLWPQGIVRRLDTWGWEIRNPNVVLRAIEPLLSSEGKYEIEETGLKCKLAKINAQSDEDNQEETNNVNSYLWTDLLDDLENVPLRNSPTVNGYPVTADLPRLFLDQFRV